MALINCDRCGKRISDKAPRCPHCGQIRNPQNSQEQFISQSKISSVAPGIEKKPYNDSIKVIYEKESNKGVLIAIISAIAVIAFGCVATFLFILPYMEEKREMEKQFHREQEMLSLNSEKVDIVTDTLSVVEPDKPALKPLTQYFLVTIEDSKIFFRGENEMARMLKGLGFNTKVYDEEVDMDMAAKYLYAYRGNTNINYYMEDGDIYIIINFADRDELSKFIKSLEDSHWNFDGTYYSKSMPNSYHDIYAKVEGLTVKMIHPFEMIPTNF